MIMRCYYSEFVLTLDQMLNWVRIDYSRETEDLVGLQAVQFDLHLVLTIRTFLKMKMLMQPEMSTSSVEIWIVEILEILQIVHLM